MQSNNINNFDTTNIINIKRITNMSGEIKLRFFDHIVWIDPNKAIRTEATHLIWMFGDTV